ncbi:tripartite motif-containing protein 59-like [Mercenaria mercenaria]|uniref:tripartite motif-containing protein 59-like n=1 Tax=Mercenaria mercenaria TaxID=6596 RepID=UPI00234F5798|nr:tripartite motif-containing protein 59-like [Mercenaria mercenaria]XP_045200083.2 tripartite motif-containing protein 59-like [Mercenaria mercenaria]XP_045200086.2 tripartite motif-containing protein 59-like [Mercenaria mercenaria]
MERTTSIEHHVTCSICMDLYNDPLALPCLHSFCRRCIQGLFSSALVFKCPECRADVKLGPKGINELPKNFQLAGIVDSYRSENDISRETNSRTRNDRPFCTHHRMTCQLMCTVCKIQICLRCVVEKHSGHKMTFLSTKKESEEASKDDIKCYDHGRLYKLYCCDCNQLTCLECVVRQHCAHSLNSIEEAHGYNTEILKGTLSDLDSRQSLLRATQKTCRTLAQKTQIDAQKKRQELTMYFSRLRDAVDKREATLRSELDHREQQVYQDYLTHSESAKRKEKLLVTAADDARRLCTENKMKFLQNYPRKINSISSLLTEESADSPPQMKGVDDVSLVVCSLEKELANIQWKWPKEELKPARKAPPVPAARKSAPSRRTQPASRHAGNHTLSVGTPVKRGKSWKDGMADGGPGHIGTITNICLDPDTYTVCWPNGKTGNYKYTPPYEEEISPP